MSSSDAEVMAKTSLLILMKKSQPMICPLRPPRNRFVRTKRSRQRPGLSPYEILWKGF